MPEAKGRRETGNPTRPRPRPRTDSPLEVEEIVHPSAPVAEEADNGVTVAQAPPGDDGDFAGGFDAETNSRYEEIKRGGTHISELQQMTMPMLLRTAKEEGLTEYTGLKKQDLIFKILKERVKQNGLMF